MLMSKSRLEKFLYALYSLDHSDLPIPRSRIEELYNCLVTGAELYEMLISYTDVYDYGKDGVAKMASAMVKVYVNLVKRGLKTLDDVPEKLRAEVEEELRGE